MALFARRIAVYPGDGLGEDGRGDHDPAEPLAAGPVADAAPARRRCPTRSAEAAGGRWRAPVAELLERQGDAARAAAGRRSSGGADDAARARRRARLAAVARRPRPRAPARARVPRRLGAARGPTSRSPTRTRPTGCRRSCARWPTRAPRPRSSATPSTLLARDVVGAPGESIVVNGPAKPDRLLGARRRRRRAGDRRRRRRAAPRGRRRRAPGRPAGALAGRRRRAHPLRDRARRCARRGARRPDARPRGRGARRAHGLDRVPRRGRPPSAPWPRAVRCVAARRPRAPRAAARVARRAWPATAGVDGARPRRRPSRLARPRPRTPRRWRARCATPGSAAGCCSSPGARSSPTPSTWPHRRRGQAAGGRHALRRSSTPARTCARRAVVMAAHRGAGAGAGRDRPHAGDRPAVPERRRAAPGRAARRRCGPATCCWPRGRRLPAGAVDAVRRSAARGGGPRGRAPGAWLRTVRASHDLTAGDLAARAAGAFIEEEDP